MNQLAPEHRNSRLSAIAIAVLALMTCIPLVAGRVLGQAHSTRMPRADEVLPGRAAPMPIVAPNAVFHTPLNGPFPAGTEMAIFGMGCFWGAEEHFFRVPGVVSTAVGFSGGSTPNPTYEEVCTGRTGHAETVRVVFDPRRISYEQLLRIFWESHDPTEGMRQGNDMGTQYRSVVYTVGEAQRRAAIATRDAYAAALRAAGHNAAITTEIREAPPFYLAEGYHQQYCALNPHGYCGHGGTGVAFPGAAAGH
jgi:peptide-methionine (S)-S-oxide reductase